MRRSARYGPLRLGICPPPRTIVVEKKLKLEPKTPQECIMVARRSPTAEIVKQKDPVDCGAKKPERKD